MQRFIAGIKAQPGNPYKQVLAIYKGSVIAGSPLKINQMRELLSEIYQEEKVAENREETSMKGLVVFKVCGVCGKKGHTKEDCWISHPEKKPNRAKRTKCYKCGKVGHLKRDCKINKYSENRENVLASLNTNKTSFIDCYPFTYIDSASSCHTVASLQLLDDGTIQNTRKTVRAVDRSAITLSHMSRRTIRTCQGMITLGEAYYGKGLKFNLISVPAMAELGVKVTFGNDKAYIEKGKVKIHLRKVDGLWALPKEEEVLHIDSPRMERGGAVTLISQTEKKINAETWHRRLGYLSNSKTKILVENKTIPQKAAQYDTSKCDICLKTKPMRRPVTNIAKRSGESVVQVDYMPMGQGEIGWKGETGAYVYSCRSHKLLKVYPVRNATT